MYSSFIRLIATFVTGSLISFYAHAESVVLDFNTGNNTGMSTIVEDGFRISPNGHFDYLWPDWPLGFPTRAIGTDGAGIPNPDFVGLPEYNFSFNGPGVIWIDHFGLNFDLKSILVSDEGSVLSSNGGDTSWSWITLGQDPFQLVPVTQSFSGPEWTNVQWIALLGFGGEPHGGYDDVTLFVSEPPILPLVLLVLGGLGLATRQRRLSSIKFSGF